MKKTIIVLLGITLFGCALTVRESTSARIRPDLTKDDDEIWEIQARGNGWMSLNDVTKNAMTRAAWTTDEEGYECFVVINNISDDETHTIEYTTKERMNFSSRSNYDTDYDTDYYGNYGNRLGSSKSRGKISGNTRGSYEVPVTHSLDVKKYSHTMYIMLFHENDCNEIATTKNKWRNNVHFKSNYLNYTK